MNFASFILLFAQARKAKRKRALEFIPDSFDFIFWTRKKVLEVPGRGFRGRFPELLPTK